MSYVSCFLVTDYRLLIIVLQECLGIDCKFCDQKHTMYCTYYMVCYTGCSLNLIVVHSFCTLQALRQPQGSRLLQPRMERDFCRNFANVVFSEGLQSIPKKSWFSVTIS